MDWLDLLQWPAMVVTIAASWFVASKLSARRNVGFWLFLVSNAMWVVWAASAAAYALIVLQIGLAIMNIRGAAKTDKDGSDAAADPEKPRKGLASEASP